MALALPSLNSVPLFFGVRGLRVHRGSNELPLRDQFFGIELEIENLSSLARKTMMGLSGWAAKSDGSLRGGGALEMVSKDAQCGEELLTNIDALYDVFARFSINDKGNSSFRTSTHVHMDFSRTDTYAPYGFSDSLLGAKNVVLVYYMLEDLFFEVAGKARRRSGYSFAYDDAPGDLYRFLVSGGEHAIGRSHRYYGLNFSSLAKFGTLEFRHMPLILDKIQLIKWLKTLQFLKIWTYQNVNAGTYDFTESSRGIEEAANYVFQMYPGVASQLDMAAVDARVEGINLELEAAAITSLPTFNAFREEDPEDEDNDDEEVEESRDPYPDPEPLPTDPLQQINRPRVSFQPTFAAGATLRTPDNNWIEAALQQLDNQATRWFAQPPTPDSENQ